MLHTILVIYFIGALITFTFGAIRGWNLVDLFKDALLWPISLLIVAICVIFLIVVVVFTFAICMATVLFGGEIEPLD